MQKEQEKRALRPIELRENQKNVTSSAVENLGTQSGLDSARPDKTSIIETFLEKNKRQIQVQTKPLWTKVP